LRETQEVIVQAVERHPVEPAAIGRAATDPAATEPATMEPANAEPTHALRRRPDRAELSHVRSEPVRPWPTRRWRPGDELLAEAATAHLSVASLSNRFLAGTGGRLPSPYLRHIANGPRPTWDAEVAVGDGFLIGWAEFGRLAATSPEADLGVIVTDPWQRRGIASELIRALLPRLAADGVNRLAADVLPSNRAAHGLLAHLFGTRLRAEYRDGIVHYDVPLLDALSDPHLGLVRAAPADAWTFAPA
jgi:GNAT superfamily N-acetyltransferase